MTSTPTAMLKRIPRREQLGFTRQAIIVSAISLMLVWSKYSPRDIIKIYCETVLLGVNGKCQF